MYHVNKVGPSHPSTSSFSASRRRRKTWRTHGQSGRALVSHHFFLIFEAISSSAAKPEPLPSNLAYFLDELADDVRSDYNNLMAAAFRGEYETCALYADQLKGRCIEQFKDGLLGLEHLAAVDDLCDLVAKGLGVSDTVKIDVPCQPFSLHIDARFLGDRAAVPYPARSEGCFVRSHMRQRWKGGPVHRCDGHLREFFAASSAFSATDSSLTSSGSLTPSASTSVCSREEPDLHITFGAMWIGTTTGAASSTRSTAVKTQETSGLCFPVRSKAIRYSVITTAIALMTPKYLVFVASSSAKSSAGDNSRRKN
ncbi:hypothetical protein Cni_G16557 [Canna indica]|uniref:Arginine decarboxylase n=1 Tax=Canna indica TaxID=4628 RepID=A0AAQ3KIW2_9LILI|nr:hypothetical protein Cni_G16557 [Canna indica]